MTVNDTPVQYVEAGPADDRRRIAVILAEAEAPGSDRIIVWLGGYRSDMSGTKAVVLQAHAAKLEIPFLRFDYSGHGQSSGAYQDGSISDWLEDTMAVIDRYAAGRKLLLVGSSMGGWIALRLIEELRKRRGPTQACGLVLIAPAPDFTHALIEPRLTDAERASLAERGYFEEPSGYASEPNRFTRKLIEDGRNNLVLEGLIDTGCPVHILQGMQDPDVPYRHALKIVEKIVGDDAILTLIRDGDHRLSRPQDLERICEAVSAMVLAD